ncbi:hypothetical protein Tsubulata_033191 [Turnera subulata]|uniref:Small nuclear ribonucleoprotein G n=1 Tax=Turnera subulata TaxID=218843 RepID=A0A9Q0J634_9ROSI|nr:hypothetical protein Tsubulata_033191 [Turnera subulata]
MLKEEHIETTPLMRFRSPANILWSVVEEQSQTPPHAYIAQTDRERERSNQKLIAEFLKHEQIGPTSGSQELNANRMVVGTLRGFDQFMNLVVDNTVEVNGEEKIDIGMVVIRGNSVVTVEALEPVNRTQ